MLVSLRKSTNNEAEHILTGGDDGNTAIVSHSIAIAGLCVAGPQTYQRLFYYLALVCYVVARITCPCLSCVALLVLRLTRHS